MKVYFSQKSVRPWQQNHFVKLVYCFNPILDTAYYFNNINHNNISTISISIMFKKLRTEVSMPFCVIVSLQ